MRDVLLYGLDETGRACSTERLTAPDLETLRGIAQARLERWHAVEVWEGPMCVLRLRKAIANA